MTDRDLYLFIKTCKNYKKVGLDVDYTILISHEDRKIYLAFQETRSKFDWKINFTFPKKPYKNQSKIYFVHRGYVKAWKSCNDDIMNDFISSCKLTDDYKPVIIGWSYGGAMAQMAAEDFCYRTNIKPNLITFGSPKILYGLKTKKHFKNSINEAREYKQINDFVTWCIPFPFIYSINKVRCGEKFNLNKLIHTEYSHTHYHEVLGD